MTNFQGICNLYTLWGRGPQKENSPTFETIKYLTIYHLMSADIWGKR